jgi:recombinational DNA repair protein (RecF pathway)
MSWETNPQNQQRYTACAECGVPLVSSYRWNRATPEQIEEWRTTGTSRHDGRGLCPAHYSWLMRRQHAGRAATDDYGLPKSGRIQVQRESELRRKQRHAAKRGAA